MATHEPHPFLLSRELTGYFILGYRPCFSCLVAHVRLHPTAAVYTTFFNIILTSVECNNVLHSLMLNGVHFTGGSLQSLSGELIMVSSHGCESMFTNA